MNNLKLAAMTAIVIGTLAAPASAQSGMSRTWVSGSTGNDGNACTRAAPCATFNGALPKTAPGGEINCVDAGGYLTPGTTLLS